MIELSYQPTFKLQAGLGQSKQQRRLVLLRSFDTDVVCTTRKGLVAVSVHRHDRRGPEMHEICI